MKTIAAALVMALCGAAGAQTPAEAPYADAVAARFPAPAVRYDTPGLQSGRQDFTSNEELNAFLRSLATPAAPKDKTVPRLLVAGASQQGEPLSALHYSRGLGRPVVLLIGQQHGDEPAGAESLLVLARSLAEGPLSALLDKIDVLLLPRANPDGAPLGLRVGAHGQDINRDHLLLRTPEARALALLVREFKPAVVVDAHEHTVMGRYLEKFNAIQRYDLLLQYAMTANLPSELSRASEAWFRQPLLQALARAGLTTEWYYTNPTMPGDLRLSMGGAQPDTARNVQGLKNAVSILLETRGVGLGRLHIERRVHTHVLALESILRSAAAHASELLALRARLDAEVAASACQGDAMVLAAQTPLRRELLMIDPETGADKSVQVQWNSSLELRPVTVRPRPCGYWLAAQADVAVQRLRELGVVLRRIDKATHLQAEAWLENALIEGPRPDVRGPIREAAPVRLVQVSTQTLMLPVPAGSWYVSLAQPLANVVVAALEPDSPNSYFANRLLPELASAARVLAPP
jgi:hypothetical protein